MTQNILFGTLTLLIVTSIELAIVLIFYLIFRVFYKTKTDFYMKFFSVLKYLFYIILGGFTLMVYSGSLNELRVFRYLVMAVIFLILLGIQKIVYRLDLLRNSV